MLLRIVEIKITYINYFTTKQSDLYNIRGYDHETQGIRLKIGRWREASKSPSGNTHHRTKAMLIFACAIFPESHRLLASVCL